MFDKLIVSEPDRAALQTRRSYFLVSSVVVGVLFITGVVISIFAADFSLGSGSLELSEILAPVEMAAPEREPIRQQPQTETRSTTRVATRMELMARTDEPTIVPTSTSVAPNTSVSRPLGPVTIAPFNSDPVTPGGTGRDLAGPASGNGGGLVAATPKSTEIEKDVEPPPARPVVPKVVSRGVINGIAQDLPKPAYSAAARAVRAQGKVDVQVTIDESGRVISARAASGHPLLREAAEIAAKRARFSPTTLSDVPVKVTGVIVYNFIL